MERKVGRGTAVILVFPAKIAPKPRDGPVVRPKKKLAMKNYNIVMIPNAVPVSVPKHYHVTKNVHLSTGISNLAIFIGQTAADPLYIKAFAILADCRRLEDA
jgi:hypothetical protein